MRNHILHLCFLLTFVVVGNSVAHAQKEKADHFILEGHRQMLLGNNSDAFELFRHGLELNPKSATALSELSNFWQYLHNDSMAIVCLKLACQYNPENYWNHEYLANLYVRSGKIDEAIKVLEKLSQQFSGKEEVLMMLVELYQQNQDYANVVNILERLEVKEGKSEQLSMEKFRTFVQMKDEQRAFKEISDLAAEYPNDLRYRVLLGDLYVNQGKPEEGMKVYRQVEAEDSTNIFLMSSMLNYYIQTGKDSLYQAQLQKISTSPKLDEESRQRFLTSLVMQNLQENKDSRPLQAIFDKVMEMPQVSPSIMTLYIRFMVTSQMTQEQVKPVLNRLLDADPESEMARNLLLQYAVESNDTQEVIRVAKPAVDYGINDPVFYYYLGVAHFQQENYQSVINTFNKGLQHVNEKSNLQLITNIYSLMGDAYHELGNNRKAFEYYDSCLAYRPDYALVLNNYAYYLSLEEKQLKRAEDMSRRSLESEKDNYTYLDTYAWILFKQKRYAAAREYIDKAIEQMGDSISAHDANIIEHAGDIYAKNRLMDEAMDFWQQSADLGNTSPVLEKKLRRRKYIAE